MQVFWRRAMWNAEKMARFCKKAVFLKSGNFFWNFFFNLNNDIESCPKFFFGNILPFSATLRYDILCSYFSWFCMFSSKMADFGQFGRPIGQCGRCQNIRPIIVSSKKFKISLSDKNSQRYLNFTEWPLVATCTWFRKKRRQTLN